jgi:Diacylglycerol kinase accessory domain
MDGQPVELPPIEGIVLLNIASWGGGCQPWTINTNGNSNKIPEARLVLLESLQYLSECVFTTGDLFKLYCVNFS